jgi:hypothetical protein
MVIEINDVAGLAMGPAFERGR